MHHRRETAVSLLPREKDPVEKTMKNSSFVLCRFFRKMHRGEKSFWYGLPYGDSNRTATKAVQRGTAPNRIVGCITAPNRTVVGFTIIKFMTCLETAPNRTVIFLISENRTEPLRGIFDLNNRTEPHRRIYYSTQPQRRIFYLQCLKAAPNRTGRFPFLVKPHQTGQ